MDLKGTRSSWNRLGRRDPFFAVLTHKDKQGGKWDRDEFFATGVREIDELRVYLAAHGIAFPRGKALDFGCGVGRLTSALAPHFEEVHGVDIAPSMIAHAHALCPSKKNCVFHVNAAPDLRMFPDNTFAFVYSKITLQHMEPRYSAAFIKEFLRVLRPYGIAVFQIPSEPSPRLKASEERRLRSLRARIRSFLPGPIVAAYEYAKHSLHPAIEMYALPRERVLELIAEAHGKTKAVREDKNAGENWLGFEYVAEKQ